MALFRGKPVAVEAWQWNGGEYDQVPTWVLEAARRYPAPGGVAPFWEGDRSLRDTNPFCETPHLALVTSDGAVVRQPVGVWLIRTPSGQLGIMPDPDFRQSFELAKAPPPLTDDFSQSFDALDWARAFMDRFCDKLSDVDDALMHTWFANAMMRGWDEHARRYPYRPTWKERLLAWVEARRRKLMAGQAAIKSSH